jgi:hypothetical protein
LSRITGFSVIPAASAAIEDIFILRRLEKRGNVQMILKLSCADCNFTLLNFVREELKRNNLECDADVECKLAYSIRPSTEENPRSRKGFWNRCSGGGGVQAIKT